MDNFRGFQEYRPNASRYNNRIREDDWNRFKPKLEDLHNQRLTRQQILDIITKDFEAAGVTVPTYGQLCTVRTRAYWIACTILARRLN